MTTTLPRSLDSRSRTPGYDARVSSLYEWAGGEAAFVRLINAFYDRVEADALLSPLFGGGVTEEHRRHVIAWWCEVFGGPTRYTDELGSYERMLAKHHDLAITPEQRFRFASLMSLVADAAELPADPEFRSAFVAYLEWGTRLAQHKLTARRGGSGARSGPTLGLGRGAAVPALAWRAPSSSTATPPNPRRPRGERRSAARRPPIGKAPSADRARRAWP